MKKMLGIIMSICLLIELTGCSSHQSKAGYQKNNSVDQVIKQQIQDSNNESTNSDKKNDKEENQVKIDSNRNVDQDENQKIDYDLLDMSREMIYSTVFQFMNSPEKYVGKRVRIIGTYSEETDSEGQKYHYCVIADATACCVQGMQFIIEDDEDIKYPKENKTIVVEGVFDKYQGEGDVLSYCGLRRASMKIKHWYTKIK